MKKSRLYKNTETAVVGENKAEQYLASSESSCKELIGEADNESCTNEGSSRSWASTLVIEVRESPFADKSDEGSKSSSDSDVWKKENYDLSKKGRHALYSDLTEPKRSGLQGNKHSEMAGLPESHNKVKMENTEYNKAEYKSERLDLTDHDTTRNMVGSGTPEYIRNHQRRAITCSDKCRCILYFTVACCVSILFASLLSYLSYRE